MIKRLFNAIDDVIATIALVGLRALTIECNIARYVFNHPIQWAEELALRIIHLACVCGISSTMKRDGHIGVDYFVKHDAETCPDNMPGCSGRCHVLCPLSMCLLI